MKSKLLLSFSFLTILALQVSAQDLIINPTSGNDIVINVGDVQSIRFENESMTVYRNGDTALSWLRDSVEYYSIEEHAYFDYNASCSKDNGENPAPGLVITIEPGDFVAMTNEWGGFNLPDLQDGTYTATLDLSGTGLYSECPLTQTFSVAQGLYSHHLSFGVLSSNPCADPNVSIFSPTIRRCSEHTFPIYVNVCNSMTATDVYSNGFVNVSLDGNIEVVSATHAYQALGDDIYQIEIGSVSPGACEEIILHVNFSCELEIGENLCMKAELYPIPECDEPAQPMSFTLIPTLCSEVFDGSNLEVTGWCANDSIYFQVQNTGLDMTCPTPLSLFIGEVVEEMQFIQLTADSLITLVFAGTGVDFTLMAEQHPLHPGNLHPNVTVEGCNDDDGDLTTDNSGDFPSDDDGQYEDTYCGEVVGSYDPNDKRGFPSGIGEEHALMPNGQLEYIIRFQNTGNAEAYTVVVRDTLDTDLNIATIELGPASHHYEFSMYGPRVLEWAFNNIMLPDSFSNEPGSHGFLTFTVDMMPNLLNGTTIENSASIYFDSNDPIITNTALHTINTCAYLVNGDTVSVDVNACESFETPQGEILTASGSYMSSILAEDDCAAPLLINLEIGLPIPVISFSNGVLTASPSGYQYSWIDCAANRVIPGATGSTMDAAFGTYSVILNNGNCSASSECIEITTLSTVDMDAQSMHLFPIPASSQLNVIWTGAPGEYKIYSMDGRQLISGQLISGQNTLNVSDLENGHYFLRTDSHTERFTVLN